MDGQAGELVQFLHRTDCGVVRARLKGCLCDIPEHRSCLLRSDRVLLAQLVLLDPDRSRHIWGVDPIQELGRTRRREAVASLPCGFGLATRTLGVEPYERRLHLGEVMLGIGFKLDRHVDQFGMIFLWPTALLFLCCLAHGLAPELTDKPIIRRKRHKSEGGSRGGRVRGFLGRLNRRGYRGYILFRKYIYINIYYSTPPCPRLHTT